MAAMRQQVWQEVCSDTKDIPYVPEVSTVVVGWLRWIGMHGRPCWHETALQQLGLHNIYIATRHHACSLPMIRMPVKQAWQGMNDWLPFEEGGILHCAGLF